MIGYHAVVPPFGPSFAHYTVPGTLGHPPLSAVVDTIAIVVNTVSNETFSPHQSPRCPVTLHTSIQLPPAPHQIVLTPGRQAHII